jgi:hypothetical protein
MKRFLINLLLFLILTCSTAIGLVLLSNFAINQKVNQLLKINEKVNMIFAGESNIECAINDSLIANSINIAQSGEAYLYSYVKIKALLEHNSQISIIFIGFSFGDLLKGAEERWLFSDEFIIEKNKLYNYLLSSSEKSLLIKKNPIAYFEGLLQSIFSNFQTFLKSFSITKLNKRMINFGGYQYLVRDKLQEDIKIHSFSEYLPEKGLFQEKYLKMISQLCQQKSIKLVLFQTPKHKYYTMNINEEIKNNWISVRNSLSQDSLLDLSTFILPDSCYGDITHLNFKGAKIFSEYLNEKLNSNQNGYLEKKDYGISNATSLIP